MKFLICLGIIESVYLCISLIGVLIWKKLKQDTSK